MSVTDYVKSSLRNHWVFLIFWLLAQALVGSLLISRKPFYNIKPLLPSLWDLKQLRNSIIEYHIISGLVLLVFGVFLFIEKIYIIIFAKGRFVFSLRQNIPWYISLSLGGHWLLLLPLLLIQYLTMNYADFLTQIAFVARLGSANNIRFWHTVHKYNAWVIVGYAFILVLEKLYVIYRTRYRTGSHTKWN